jgi:tetratricopeptide (TPR) repeat protein
MEITLPLGRFYIARRVAMNRIQTIGLWGTSLFLLLSCGSLTSATPSPPFNIAQSTGYQKAMQSGYNAAAKQDYGKALEHFNRALKLQPGDRNAQTAINNLKDYQGNKKGFHVSPSGIGAPSVREGAASRLKNCLDGKKLVAIIPVNQLGLTSLAKPTLLFYIPPTSAKSLRVKLTDNAGATVYERTSKTPPKPGITEFNFADFDNSPSLKPETPYKWSLTLHCDPQDTSADVTVSGAIQRAKINPILLSQIEAVSMSDRANLYAINGLWYDAVKALAKARQQNPTDAKLAEDWSALIRSVQLEQELGG